MQALLGGVTVVQIREKDTETSEVCMSNAVLPTWLDR